MANIFLVEGKNDVNGFFVAFILRCKTAASHPRSHAQKKGFNGERGHYKFKALNHRLMEVRGLYYKFAEVIEG